MATLPENGIEVRALHVRYPEAHALRGVDLSVAPGSFLLIGGPSGGGKSTLAQTLMGLIPQMTPAEVRGQLSVGGLDPRQQPVAQMATRVGLVLQNPATQLFNGTVEEEVAFGPRNLGLPPEEIATRVEYGLEAAGCAHLRHRPVRRLSGGEQQRVVIAAVLAMRPAILILDEPTANLDAEGVGRIVQTLVRLHRRFQITIVVVEHRLDPFLPHADRLVWLAEGRVVADGPPAETLAISSSVPRRFIASAVANPSPRSPSRSKRATMSERERALSPKLKARVSPKARPAISRPAASPSRERGKGPSQRSGSPSRSGPRATPVRTKIQNRGRRRGRSPWRLHARPKASSRSARATSPPPSRRRLERIAQPVNSR